ncbi:hypothetical protein FE257_006999 [Aspergillus nanangensis]|uniref:Uncharacterized protein n=1 Tax=Aspergillus nanangensis TaxID=2582783 RepID=A0AAD4GVP7_ASPNN|nr:hypothetical protein FE257_006999 [Aspergillus nanangensis]
MPPPMKPSYNRKKTTRSFVSEDPWGTTGPSRITHLPGTGIRRIRNTLSKLSSSSRAERELLKQKNRCKVPLTERNVDKFTTAQEFTDLRFPGKHNMETQVSAWLERLAY